MFLQEEDLLIVKNYDIDSVLISEDFIKNKKYIKSLWHIRDGKKYEFIIRKTKCTNFQNEMYFFWAAVERGKGNKKHG